MENFYRIFAEDYGILFLTNYPVPTLILAIQKKNDCFSRIKIRTLFLTIEEVFQENEKHPKTQTVPPTVKFKVLF